MESSTSAGNPYHPQRISKLRYAKAHGVYSKALYFETPEKAAEFRRQLAQFYEIYAPYGGSEQRAVRTLAVLAYKREHLPAPPPDSPEREIYEQRRAYLQSEYSTHLGKLMFLQKRRRSLRSYTR